MKYRDVAKRLRELGCEQLFVPTLHIWLLGEFSLAYGGSHAAGKPGVGARPATAGMTC